LAWFHQASAAHGSHQCIVVQNNLFLLDPTNKTLVRTDHFQEIFSAKNMQGELLLLLLM
jgi:hypothetical protein